MQSWLKAWIHCTGNWTFLMESNHIWKLLGECMTFVTMESQYYLIIVLIIISSVRCKSVVSGCASPKQTSILFLVVYKQFHVVRELPILSDHEVLRSLSVTHFVVSVSILAT